MITLDHVAFAYPDQTVGCLRDISLSIREGESVCVMGPNGCGKSTLANLIAGLIKPGSGTLTINLSGNSDNTRLPIGLLFQDPDNQMVAALVDKEITFVLENLAVSVSEMRRIVANQLERFGIERLAHRLTTELSGGEKQRVALASIMAGNPSILILDEPDSYLDETGQRILQNELRRLHQENPALIEVRITQYTHVAREYQRLLVIQEGQVQADGPASKILSDRTSTLKWGLEYDFSSPSVRTLPDLGYAYRPQSTVDRIEVADMCFRYADKDILTSHNFVWPCGEAICIVGPSGSGKSTLGHLLCGLLNPKSGCVQLVYNSLERARPADKPGVVAGLFQQPERQFFLPTVREELVFGPANRGRMLTAEMCESLLDAVGLGSGEILSRDPFTLSMGEKRRLAFAVVLALDTQFIVFDEPTCALDPAGVGNFVSLSKLLKAKHVGQCIISHDPDVVASLADRVFFLPGDGTLTVMSPAEWFGDAKYREVMSLPSFGYSQ